MPQADVPHLVKAYVPRMKLSEYPADLCMLVDSECAEHISGEFVGAAGQGYADLRRGIGREDSLGGLVQGGHGCSHVTYLVIGVSNEGSSKRGKMGSVP